MRTFSAQLNLGVKSLTKPIYVKGSYPFGMNDIYAIRRRNLTAALQSPQVSRLSREQDKALLLGISASMFSQAKHPEYKMGDDLARKVEAALGLESGWMDNDHERFTTSQSTGLNPEILSKTLEVLEQEFRKYGHPFSAKDEAEIVALTYDYLSESLGNVVEMKGFLKGLIRGRGVGQSEVGTVGEKVGGAPVRRAAGKA